MREPIVGFNLQTWLDARQETERCKPGYVLGVILRSTEKEIAAAENEINRLVALVVVQDNKLGVLRERADKLRAALTGGG